LYRGAGSPRYTEPVLVFSALQAPSGNAIRMVRIVAGVLALMMVVIIILKRRKGNGDKKDDF
jgi:hypothetical protein